MWVQQANLIVIFLAAQVEQAELISRWHRNQVLVIKSLVNLDIHVFCCVKYRIILTKYLIVRWDA